MWLIRVRQNAVKSSVNSPGNERAARGAISDARKAKAWCLDYNAFDIALLVEL